MFFNAVGGSSSQHLGSVLRAMGIHWDKVKDILKNPSLLSISASSVAGWKSQGVCCCAGLRLAESLLRTLFTLPRVLRLVSRTHSCFLCFLLASLSSFPFLVCSGKHLFPSLSYSSPPQLNLLEILASHLALHLTLAKRIQGPVGRTLPHTPNPSSLLLSTKVERRAGE